MKLYVFANQLYFLTYLKCIRYPSNIVKCKSQLVINKIFLQTHKKWLWEKKNADNQFWKVYIS